jgi:hypothetical protein
MRPRQLACIALVWGAIAGTAMSPIAAQVRPMSVDQVERLLHARVPANQILETAHESCVDFRIDDVELRLARAGADASFIERLRTVCQRITKRPDEPPNPPRDPAPQPAHVDVPGPESVFVNSLLVPGLGQFRTGRPALGVLFLGAWGGALGAGWMQRETTIVCLDRVVDSCPTDQIRDETTRRPFLALGLGSAAVIAVVSAFDARSAALRMRREDRGPAGAGLEPLFAWRADGFADIGLRLRW